WACRSSWAMCWGTTVSSRDSEKRRGRAVEARAESTMKGHRTATVGLAMLLAVAVVCRTLGQAAPSEATPIVTVTVDATHPWIDSGLTVRKGERLSFEATGTIQWGSDPDQVAGPEGHGAK